MVQYLAGHHGGHPVLGLVHLHQLFVVLVLVLLLLLLLLLFLVVFAHHVDAIDGRLSELRQQLLEYRYDVLLNLLLFLELQLVVDVRVDPGDHGQRDRRRAMVHVMRMVGRRWWSHYVGQVGHRVAAHRDRHHHRRLLLHRFRRVLGRGSSVSNSMCVFSR